MTGTFLTVAVNAMSGNVTGPIILAGLLIVFLCRADRSHPAVVLADPPAAGYRRLALGGGHAEEGWSTRLATPSHRRRQPHRGENRLEASKEIQSKNPG